MSKALRRLPLYAVAAGALLSVAPPAAAAPQTHTVVVDKMKFAPVPAVRRGDTILWVNRDILRHSATSPGHFDVDLPPNSKVAMKVTAAGSFAFVCKYHPGMRGVLTVR
jgi:plastocyanin